MSRRVYKMTIAADASHAVRAMPPGAEIKHVREQGNEIAMWFECDPSATLTGPQERTFEVFNTGEVVDRRELPPGGRRVYVGTAIFNGGHYVRHVYEIEGARS